jgi:hypothetical protein
LKSFLVGALELGIIFCAEAASPEEQASAMDVSCVTSLHLPTHGFFAARAPHSGTVHATVHLGTGGTPSKTQLVTDTPNPEGLEAEVRTALAGSDFAPRCAGRALEFFFAFTLEEPPADSILPPTVRFVPPNRFELVFRKVKPNYDPAPQRKPAHK